MYAMCNIPFMTDYGWSWRIIGGHDTVWSAMRCWIPTYVGVALTAHRDAPHLFMARYDTHTLLWRVRGAHKELGRSCLLVLDCSGAWRDVGSYVRCAVLPMCVSSQSCIRSVWGWHLIYIWSIVLYVSLVLLSSSAPSFQISSECTILVLYLRGQKWPSKF